VTQSGTKKILTVANPFLTHSRSKVSYQSLLQKLFEKKYAWVAAINPWLLTCFEQTGSAK